MADDNELTGQERAALVAWHLASGKTLTVEQTAGLTGLSYSGAYRLLCSLSRVLPIAYDNSAGYHLGYWCSVQHHSRYFDKKWLTEA